jgi:hypothetical protein
MAWSLRALVALLSGELAWHCRLLGHGASSSAVNGSDHMNTPPPPSPPPAVGAPRKNQEDPTGQQQLEGSAGAQLEAMRLRWGKLSPKEQYPQTVPYTIAYAVHRLVMGDPGESSPPGRHEQAGRRPELVVHSLAAAAVREGSLAAAGGGGRPGHNFAAMPTEAYAVLCELLPRYDRIVVVLVGPRMHKDQHKRSGEKVVPRPAGDCTVVVQGFRGVYGPAVFEAWPTQRLDLVLGFGVDLYTCSWRGALLYLLHLAEGRLRPRLAFTFFMPQEPVYACPRRPGVVKHH